MQNERTPVLPWRSRRSRVRALGVAVVWSQAASLAAATIYHADTWGTDNGLPDSTVTAPAQTPNGYWWVGTPNGLARFDGVRFTTFAALNIPELGSGPILSLLTDSSGMLWIATADGALERMKDGGFTAFRPPGERGAIRTLTAARDGTLWFTTDRSALGGFREGVFLPAPTNLLSLVGPLKLHAGFGGAVRVSGAKEMVLCAGQDGMPARVGFERDAQPLTPSRAGDWCFAGPNCVRLWRAGGWMTAIPLASNLVSSVQAALEDSLGQLWLGTAQDGLLCCATNAPVQRFTTADGLGSDAALCLFEDVRGAIWVGTERGGLSRLRRTPFRVVGRKDGLSSEFITSVCEGAGGGVWIGTDGGGLNLLQAGGVQSFTATNGLAALRVRSVCVDAAQSLWVAAQGGRLFVREAEEFKDRSARCQARPPFAPCSRTRAGSYGRAWRPRISSCGSSATRRTASACPIRHRCSTCAPSPRTRRAACGSAPKAAGCFAGMDGTFGASPGRTVWVRTRCGRCSRTLGKSCCGSAPAGAV